MRKAFHLFLFFDILFHLFDSFVAACPKQWLDGTEDFKNTGTIDNKKVVFDSFVAACPKQCSQPPAGKTEDSGESFCRCSLLVQLCLHKVLPKNTAENTALKNEILYTKCCPQILHKIFQHSESRCFEK